MARHINRYGPSRNNQTYDSDKIIVIQNYSCLTWGLKIIKYKIILTYQFLNFFYFNIFKNSYFNHTF